MFSWFGPVVAITGPEPDRARASRPFRTDNPCSACADVVFANRNDAVIAWATFFHISQNRAVYGWEQVRHLHLTFVRPRPAGQWYLNWHRREGTYMKRLHDDREIPILCSLAS